ncbi:hypothetical protein M9Y10_023484 [Tritrichomonas musculus]|uniref:Small GTP-binding protein n=1 Tax=Tritrichomonas musculus TaxID=1915356 RepID=A0ABR2KV89_9EUKA
MAAKPPQADQKSSSPAPSKPSTQPVCKIAFLGGAGVGKTSLINRFMYDQFTRNYETTVGVDYFTKSMNVDDTTMSLQIWDTAGQEQFQSLVPSYIRNTGIVIIVYDVSDPKTLESAKTWFDTTTKIRGNDVRCVLAGNKIDLSSNVEESDVDEFIKANPMPHLLVSAKTGEKVTDLFVLAAREAYKSEITKKDTITVTAQTVTTVPESKSSGCC